MVKSLHIIVLISLSLICAALCQPSTNSSCANAVAEIVSRTYPNENSLILNSGRGPRDLGNYDECQATDGAHYCLLSIHQREVVVLLTGLCAPSVCSASEINGTLEQILHTFNVSVPPEDVTTVRCIEKSNFQPPTTGGIAVLSVIGFLVFVSFFGTAIDYYRRRRATQISSTHERVDADLAERRFLDRDQIDPKEFDAVLRRLEESSPAINGGAESDSETAPLRPIPNARQPSVDTATTSHRIAMKVIQFFLAFSFISNMEKLLAPSPEENLASLNGIRVISMLWIMLGHTVLFSANLVLNIQYVLEHVIGSWAFMLIPGAEFSVDTFFYMSGFLVAYLTLKTLDTKKTINWALFYFHRVWRIIPPLLMMILVAWKVAPLFGNGPFWVAFAPIQQQCDQSWWATLLHIQNFYPDFDSTCVGWTWYLANDMQYYIISPAIVFLYWKKPKFGVALIGALMVAALISSTVINIQGGFYARASSPGHGWTDKIYNKPYIRIPAYLVGVLFAFLLRFIERRRKNTGNRQYGQLPFIVEVGAVLSCVAVISLLVFVTHNNYGPDAWAPTDVRSVLWNVFARPLWTTCIGVFVHLYATGHGLIFRSILGAHFWTPFARLTYSAYLYHPVIMFGVYFSLKSLIHYDAMTMTVYTIAFAVISYLTALGSFLLIERPLINLEKMILPGRH